jgi:DNA-binding transcriptional regulator YiaG
MYHYTDGGLRNVWLANGDRVQKTPYGEAVAIDDLQGLTQAICTAMTKKPSKLTGAEFRYLRNGLMLSQPSLGQMLGVSGQAVALWEKTGKVPKMADAMIRLVYTAHTNGHEQVKNIVTALNEGERFTVTLSDTAKGWRASTETAAKPTRTTSRVTARIKRATAAA